MKMIVLLLKNSQQAKKYHLDSWEEVKFFSRNSNIEISGWLFNYHKNKPIVIIVHGIFPNGKCKSEPNLIASLLIANEINALTIDLRNYGESTIVSNYENLGLTEYMDVLGETALSYNSSDVSSFNPQGVDPVNGNLGEGELSMNEITNLLNNK